MRCHQVYVEKEFSPKDIPADVVTTLGDYTTILSRVQKWASESMSGRENLDDGSRSGRRANATTEETVDYVHYMEMDVKRLTINQIAKAVDTTMTTC